MHSRAHTHTHTHTRVRTHTQTHTRTSLSLQSPIFCYHPHSPFTHVLHVLIFILPIYPPTHTHTHTHTHIHTHLTFSPITHIFLSLWTDMHALILKWTHTDNTYTHFTFCYPIFQSSAFSFHSCLACSNSHPTYTPPTHTHAHPHTPPPPHTHSHTHIHKHAHTHTHTQKHTYS